MNAHQIRQVEQAAGTIEAAVHRLACMAEPGYGGDISVLVELLQSEPEVLRLRAENARLKEQLDETRKERDDAVALIKAAKIDTRPESFLEHAQAILAKCIAPYSCEQMKVVADALAVCYRKWGLMSAVAARANEERDAIRAERDKTEAALRRLCAKAGNSPTDYEFICPDDLRDLGLWREPEVKS